MCVWNSNSEYVIECIFGLCQTKLGHKTIFLLSIFFLLSTETKTCVRESECVIICARNCNITIRSVDLYAYRMVAFITAGEKLFKKSNWVDEQKRKSGRVGQKKNRSVWASVCLSRWWLCRGHCMWLRESEKENRE